MGFERSYQLKNPSNQISFTQTRFCSTDRHNAKSLPYKPSVQLSSWFITGLSDGESCFYVGIPKNNKSKLGWTVELIFTITLHIKDRGILEQIKSYFGVGYITKHGSNTNQYRVKSIKDLEVIINHFEKYPLTSQKLGDYLLFKMVFDLIKSKEHLTVEGLNKIVGIRANVNTGVNDNLKEAFPKAIPMVRPLVVNKTVPNPDWFAGFSSAEACFLVNIKESTSNLVGYQVWLSFTLTQHNRDELLMKSFETYLACGSLEKSSRGVVNFIVRRYLDNLTKIIPFF